LGLLSLSFKLCAQDSIQTVRGHAHNDYVHEHPLYDALHEGFRSVEVDLQVTFGKLSVAHTPFGVFRNRHIEKLYLEPLRNIITTHHGSVYGDGKVFYLIIEIKLRPERAMPHLKKILAKYQDIISTYHDTDKTQRAVDVIMIAHTPKDFGQEDSLRFVGSEMHGAPENQSFFPLVSIVVNDTSEKAFSDLKQRINGIHKQGRIVRAWGKHDDETTWDFLLKAGVDLVHTDRLADFRKYYLAHLSSF